ncbi:MAG: beta-propeller domain-containing protein [Acholeplasmataceae bacterium]
MTTFGWIVISVLSLVVLYLMYNFVMEFILNKKLSRFKHKIHSNGMKVSQVIMFRKAYQVALGMLLVFTLGISGIFEDKIILDNQKVLTQAHQVGSKSKLLSLLDINTDDWYYYAPESELESTAVDFDQSSESRDYIGTNEQVDGVSEADIIKTDGNYIYYASRYYQQINVVFVNDDYEVEVLDSIDLGDVYTEDMYLTDEYIIVIGYTYQTSPYEYEVGAFFIDWYYRAPSGTVVVVDRVTNEIVYEVETDAYFFDHRVIENQMYLVSTKYIYNTDEELRPQFTETKNSNKEDSFVDYDDIYYYEDVTAQSMTVITSIDLELLTYDAQAFLGHVSQIYVDQDNIYTAFNYYEYADESYTTSYFSKIIKFSIDPVDQSISYQGGQTVIGHILDQYWMDEYEGYLRVVTTEFSLDINRLYILEEDFYEDKLNIVSKIDEGLGLENENVKSVRFNKDYVQVVTFEQTDPLYTIDLSDPLNPFIKENPIKEDGYSTYMHVWNEDYYLIGFGFDATPEGQVTGMKLSAYDTRLDKALDTYSFASDKEAGFGYSFSEAIYNPKALMIDASRGIVGFPMNLYRYTESSYYYESSFVIFFIDFDSENVISEPIFISHDQTDYYMQVDRGIYIENIIDDIVVDRYIYTFSYEQVLVYHIESDMIIQKEQLNDAVNAYDN